jgi:hypothetical protein
MDAIAGGDIPTMALIDRMGNSGCDLAETIQDIQRLGIQAVLVADDVCQCVTGIALPPPAFLTECYELGRNNKARLNYENSPEAPLCDIVLPQLLDQNFASVTVPTILIDWVVAKQIKNCLIGAPNSNCIERSVVIGTLRWNQRTDPVSVELWSSSEADWGFKQTFAAFASRLQKRVIFQPRYFVFDA